VARQLAEEGRTIIIVEQNVAAALSIAQRVYIINPGHLVYEGAPAELHAQPQIMHEYLGV